MSAHLYTERLMRPSDVAAALSRHRGQHVSTYSAVKWTEREGIRPVQLNGPRRFRARDVFELIKADSPVMFIEVRVTPEDVIGGDIRSDSRHPVALAIRAVLPRGSKVTTGPATAECTLPGCQPVTVPLPEEAVRFSYTLRNRMPADLPTFRIEIPQERAA
jgi:hypothetical protein